MGRSKITRFWTKEEHDPKAAEWMKLQKVSVLISTCVKEWQYKEILNFDNLAWEDLSEEWCASPCLAENESRCRSETAVHSLFCEMRRPETVKS